MHELYRRLFYDKCLEAKLASRLSAWLPRGFDEIDEYDAIVARLHLEEQAGTPRSTVCPSWNLSTPSSQSPAKTSRSARVAPAWATRRACRAPNERRRCHLRSRGNRAPGEALGQPPPPTRPHGRRIGLLGISSAQPNPRQAILMDARPFEASEVRMPPFRLGGRSLHLALRIGANLILVSTHGT